jgi:hypothetical protein
MVGRLDGMMKRQAARRPSVFREPKDYGMPHPQTRKMGAATPNQATRR